MRCTESLVNGIFHQKKKSEFMGGEAPTHQHDLCTIDLTELNFFRSSLAKKLMEILTRSI